MLPLHESHSPPSAKLQRFQGMPKIPILEQLIMLRRRNQRHKFQPVLIGDAAIILGRDKSDPVPASLQSDSKPGVRENIPGGSDRGQDDVHALPCAGRDGLLERL